MLKNLRFFLALFLFSTLGAGAQTLFSEDFNAVPSTTSVPSGWVLVNMDGRPGASNVSTLTGNSTNAWTFPGVFNNLMRSAVSVSWTNPVGAVDRWMISPSITLPATGNYYLIYDAQSLGNANYPEAYELRLSNGDTARSSFLTSAPLFSTTAENLSLTTRGFSLAPYAGTTIRFAFRNISNDMVAMLVDNIRITVPAFEEVRMVQHSVPSLGFTNSPVTIAGSFRNLGLNAVSSGNLNYRVNGGPTTSQPYSGSVASFATDAFTFSSTFSPNSAGSYSIEMWVSGVNGTTVGSDTLTATLNVVDPAPPVQSNLVIYEHFTNASCGPCATYNPQFQALLLANNSEVTSVKHHTSWPGTDPMYSFNTGDPTSRVNYYGITGVPAVRLGNMLSSNPANITQANLDDNIANLPSNWYYNINTTINGSTLVVTGSVRGKSTQANTDNKLWLYLVEDPINYATAPGTNGEREFPSVLRKILPTSSGINCGNGSQNTTINASYPLSPTFVRDNLYLLAFVQANGTKEANKGVKIKLGNSLNTTSVADLGVNAPSFSVYPNPSNDVLNIRSERANGEIVVQNALGQKVYQANLGSNEGTIRIPTGEWQEGLYLVHLQGAQGQILGTRKVLVRH
ncbi:MAG: choice-of-anchor J domain-containing protein [Bacteroidia bacterium]